MDRRKKRKRPDYFKVEIPEKKRKVVDVGEEKPITKPLRRTIPYENLLVWGRFRGLGWWPGRIADRCELSGPLDPEDDPTRWVNWFGDHKYTETRVDDIAPFHLFNDFFRPKKLDCNIAYREAVLEALKEACKRSELEISSPDGLISWAEQGFPPGGYVDILPEMKEEIKQRFLSASRSKDQGIDAEKDDCRMAFLQKRNKALVGIRNRSLNIEDICLSCGAQDVECRHPCFEGGLCKVCKTQYVEVMHLIDDCGNGSYCYVCGGGQEIVYCEEEGCHKSFCSDCIREFAGTPNVKYKPRKRKWICYLCKEHHRCGLLVKRKDWRKLLQGFMTYCNDVVYVPLCPNFQSTEKRRIKVLSLFDGISVGMVALKQLDFDIASYYASEIDECALYISRAHHPEIHHIGDVRKLNNKELKDWGPFDLLIGGSPCNDLAIVNPSRKGLWSDEGSGYLFFEFCRIMNACGMMAAVQQRPFFWLFENVVHMDQDSKEAITRFLQRTPVLLDAAIVSPAKRPRLFWGNLPGMHRPLKPRPGDRLILQDCMEAGRKALSPKIGTITTNADTVTNKAFTESFPVMDTSQKQKDRLWVTEIERVFGLPDHYTDKSNLSTTLRRKVLGRTWSVPVIRHLLAPLREFFC